ncbi:metallophosphoesterase [Furfurilactobacillus rossiae]|uniref:Phosphoesterase n=1 Tax=Furfurilactobacillus rossiae DSM 15814 TaxID=1114972 RepID=A0A0R1RAS0_9LACO|nr:metallophosphoesterase [Furfurilactobacillus rossiae]KRL54127.1 phosphoesterase [Furfurilactobacillus rossiae DSM 15814]QFR66286.1 metallophosphatase [Furfurilactobacillus rossiae]QLE61733.1 Phosphoesterase [Furfurilactobacillus rossiae]
MRYFTSDTHFYHKELLGMNDFAPRPFLTVEDMNETIIKNWNSVVTDTDTVYHLGDIAMYFTRPAITSHIAVNDILHRLNGHIVLIKGNHDNRALFKYLAAHNENMLDGKPKFEFHDVGAYLKYDHRQYYLTHYPFSMGIVGNIINLHGHIHHYAFPAKENINVGVDTPEKSYIDHEIPFGRPFSFAEIEQMIEGKAVDYKKRH